VVWASAAAGKSAAAISRGVFISNHSGGNHPWSSPTTDPDTRGTMAA
jgi:hypothetical protein